jgi:succinylglutamate desuccinylase
MTENKNLKINSRFLSCDINGNELTNFEILKEAYEKLVAGHFNI